MSRPKRDLKRININLNVNVLELVDAWAEQNGVTRTTAITILLTQQLTKK